ncbi:MAG: type II secretion system major pseudopilin GspG [Candidatus Omnitrophica bacterium]|nr:type II secretion system major pseudopilin GspG [Candidatus Omnitrophota bacterium]
MSKRATFVHRASCIVNREKKKPATSHQKPEDARYQRPDKAAEVNRESWPSNHESRITNHESSIAGHGSRWFVDCGPWTVAVRSTQYAVRSTLYAVRCTSAFTLIELMVVVIIIGALVAMVTPRLAGRGEQAKTAAARADIQANIATGLKLYELDNGAFPTTTEGLNALMAEAGSAANWNGPYLEKAPLDPWGRAYQYQSPGQHRKDYDLFSLGRDGSAGTDDDVDNWE